MKHPYDPEELDRRACEAEDEAVGTTRCDTCGDLMEAPLPEGWRCRHCQRDIGDGGLG